MVCLKNRMNCNTVTGLMGFRAPRYSLVGDTVNTSVLNDIIVCKVLFSSPPTQHKNKIFKARMETNGMPGRIHCSSTTYELLKDIYKFRR
jgi:hypothetical protein